MATGFESSAFFNQAFYAGRELVGAAGAVTLAGNAAGGGITLPGAAGSVALVRNSASMFAARRLPAAAGASPLTGVAATFGITLPGTPGSYPLAIKAGALTTRLMPLLPGEIVQIRFAAGLQKAMVPRGAYPLTGRSANGAVVMPLDGGSYTIGGFANSRSVGRQPLASGAYSYAGRTARFPLTIDAEQGEFAFTPFESSFGVSRIGFVGPIQVINKKNSADFLWTKIVYASHCDYNVLAPNIYIGRRFSIGGFASFGYLGYAAELRDRRQMADQAGAYILVDSPALLLRGGVFDFDASEAVMTVPAEAWVMRCG